MAEQLSRHTVLTDTERTAIEQPGLRQRAKTLVALSELTIVLGVSPDTAEALLARVRLLSGHEAKDLRKGLSMLSKLAGESDMAECYTADNTPDAYRAQPNIEIIESAGQTEVITETDGYTYGLEEVRSFYKTINKKTNSAWLTPPDSAADINHEEVTGLIALDAQYNKKPKNAARTVDSLIAALTPDAPSTQSIHSLRYGATNRISAILDRLEIEQTAIPTGPLVDGNLDKPAIQEGRPLDQEPAHVQLACRFEALLQFDSAETTAFRCLIDPSNRGEMTANKHRAITKLRERIEQNFGSLHALHGELTAAQIARVAHLLGYSLKPSVTSEYPPLQLSQQLKRVEKLSERTEFIDDLHTGLRALAERLGESNDVEVLALPAVKPLQVHIADGKAVLA